MLFTIAAPSGTKQRTLHDSLAKHMLLFDFSYLISRMGHSRGTCPPALTQKTAPGQTTEGTIALKHFRLSGNFVPCRAADWIVLSNNFDQFPSNTLLVLYNNTLVGTHHQSIELANSSC